MKRDEVSHGQVLADVAFYVGADVLVEPAIGGNSPLVNGRVAAFPDRLPQVVDRRQFFALLDIERQQFEQRRAAGQGLRHVRTEGEVGGASKDEAAWLGIMIHHALKVAEEIGRSLHFVDNGPGLDLFQKASRIFERVSPLVRIFERHVALTREGHLAERRFARLAGSGYRDTGNDRARSSSMGSIRRFSMYRL